MLAHMRHLQSIFNSLLQLKGDKLIFFVGQIIYTRHVNIDMFMLSLLCDIHVLLKTIILLNSLI